VYEDLKKSMAGVCGTQAPSSVFRNILPSFFRTVAELVTMQKEHGGPAITIVFRTFGTDLPEIAKAITAFARGQHKDYPNFIHPEYELPVDRLYQAKWMISCQTDNTEEYQYHLFPYSGERDVASEQSAVALGDEQVLTLLHNTNGGHVFGIREDYDMWRKHNWEPWAGKPVWVTKQSKEDNPSEIYHHHVLFDDNIHNLPHDGIASVRRPVVDTTIHREAKSEASFTRYESLPGTEIQAMHGLHLIRVPTVEPMLNHDWFLQQVAKVQAAVNQKYLSLDCYGKHPECMVSETASSDRKK